MVYMGTCNQLQGIVLIIISMVVAYGKTFHLQFQFDYEGPRP